MNLCCFVNTVIQQTFLTCCTLYEIWHISYTVYCKTKSVSIHLSLRIYILTHPHTHIYIYIYIRIHINKGVYIYIYIYIYIHACVYIIGVCIYSIYICKYICVISFACAIDYHNKSNVIYDATSVCIAFDISIHTHLGIWMYMYKYIAFIAIRTLNCHNSMSKLSTACVFHDLSYAICGVC